MTEPEVMLWSRLRRRADQAAFRRQHPIGTDILDFCCPAAKLAVEIDGAVHGEPEQAAHDRRRDDWLRGQGLTVQRISAAWVYEDVDDAADAMRRLAAELIARQAAARAKGNADG